MSGRKADRLRGDLKRPTKPPHLWAKSQARPATLSWRHKGVAGVSGLAVFSDASARVEHGTPANGPTRHGAVRGAGRGGEGAVVPDVELEVVWRLVAVVPEIFVWRWLRTPSHLPLQVEFRVP